MKNIIANIPGVRTLLNYTIAVYYKLKSKHLIIGYNNELRGVIFGQNNALGKNISIFNSEIDSYTYLSNDCIVRNAKIGKFCSIGPSVKIGLGKHPFNEFLSSHPLFYSNRKQIGFSILKDSKFEEFEEVSIGNDVWIGANVIILDGVNVGDGAVIAAGSVVIQNVEPFSLVAGTPAVHKKYKFSKKKIDEILNNPWWNKDIDYIKKLITKA